MYMKIVEEEEGTVLQLVDYFEEPSKFTGDEFKNLLPTHKHNTFDIQKINYLIGNVNICNKDMTNDLRTYYIKNTLELTQKQKLNLLVDNYKNYWDLPEEFIFSIAKEKLGEKWDYEDIQKRRKKWLEKKKLEEEQDKQEIKFQKELERQKKKEPNFKIEKKTINF